MKGYFAYIRVSTVKQGEHGSSLHEQRDAITAFAARNGLTISAWFEERETAAKIGRGEFSRMLAALKNGKASGVIFHKIDRSARNLKDWSVIQDLAEQGIDVRFTQESINMGSNEGKLTGDFLAVIASHYIRNLREEVKKGIRGRLKQGIYPFNAPAGYLDQGGGKPKIPDPMRAPFVRDAFELYRGGYSLHALSDELHRRGFRTKTGKKVGVNRLSGILRNPFYIGVIRLKRSGETFRGIHEPLVTARIFDAVQARLDGKMNAKIILHDFVFRRMIACASCRYHLIGERQKGYVYYRCHNKECPTCSVREEVVDAAVHCSLTSLEFREEDMSELRKMVHAFGMDLSKTRDDHIGALRLQIDALSARLSRLTDAYIDGTLERSLFERKQYSLLLDLKGLEEQRTALRDGHAIERDLLDFLERLEALPLTYKIANVAEKRDVLKNVTSNLIADRKDVAVELRSPFREIANLVSVPTGAPLRSRPRTFVKQAFDLLVKHFTAQANERQRREQAHLNAA